MQPVSAKYEDIMRYHEYYMETCVVIGDKGVLITEKAERILFGGVAISVSKGGIESGYGETMLISVKTTRRVFSNNVPEVGCCPSGEIYVEMHMPKAEIARQAVVIPYVRLVATDEDNLYSEWIRKGVFHIDTRDNTHNDDDLDILTIHGYDSMMFAEQPYGEFFDEYEFTVEADAWTKSNGVYTATIINSAVVPEKDVSVEYLGDDSIEFGKYVTYERIQSGVKLTARQSPIPNLYGKLVLRKQNTIGFPAKDIDVVRDIASKMGVDIDARTIPYINQQYMIEYPAEYTMREVLGFIGAMYGGNWIMSDNDELQLIPLWDLPPESSLLIDELGYRITFGGDRISLVKTNV